MKTPECDIETGTCELSPPDSQQAAIKGSAVHTELVYVGDPMCSWCWGIAPALEQLQNFCHQQQLPFRVVVGGLRPGGGDFY